MKDLRTVFLPIGVPTFDMPCARALCKSSVETLGRLCPGLIFPDDIILSPEAFDDFTAGLDADLVIVQNTTFANSVYAARVCAAFDCPIVLWSLKEPVNAPGTVGRLHLNSLTGAYSAANNMRALGRGRFGFVVGSPDDPQTVAELKAQTDAARVKSELRSLTIASVGHTPPGFGFGRALDNDLLRVFGTKLVSIEARELIEKAKSFSDDDIASYLSDAKTRIRGLDEIPQQNVSDFARLYRAYDEFVKKNGIGALSSRCWPDFFTAFGTPVCAVLAMLGDLGVPAACEADTYGALSMYIGQSLSGSPVFFGDPVAFDADSGTLTYWHCGTAACSLARDDTGAAAGCHCNRGIGPTLEFGCRPSDKAVVFRIGREADGSMRAFLCTGSVPDLPQQFKGTSVVVKTDSPVAGVVQRSVTDGWEPHFCVIFADCSAQIRALCRMLGIGLLEY